MEEVLRKRLSVLVAAVMMLLLASGVALAITKQCKPNVNCVGTENPDTLTGTQGPDLIRGLAGNDTIRGLRGSDLVYGNAGNDGLNGGRAPDLMVGGTGDDTQNGGKSGDDYMFEGSWGEDTIIDIPEVKHPTRSTDSRLLHAVDFPRPECDTPVRDLAIKLNSNSGLGPEVTDGVNTVNWDGNVITVVGNENPGNDAIRGNDQTNHIENKDVCDPRGLTSGTDTIKAGAGADEVDNLGSGNVTDKVYGGTGSDLLISAGGVPPTRGETHPDKVFGGGSTDYINVSDNLGGDTVECGESFRDKDEVYYDKGDVISPDCERKFPSGQ
jgi:Ca2+-binding RTX toxin-like protein